MADTSESKQSPKDVETGAKGKPTESKSLLTISTITVSAIVAGLIVLHVLFDFMGRRRIVAYDPGFAYSAYFWIALCLVMGIFNWKVKGKESS